MFFCCTSLVAQGLGGTVKPKGPPPKAVPAPAQPKTKSIGGNKTQKPGKPKAATLKDLDEARKRRREKLEKIEAESSDAEAQPVVAPKAIPKVSSPWNLIFQLPDDKDVKVLSTSWETMSRRRANPFTALSVELSNRTGSYICVDEIVLNGSKVTVFDDNDKRPLPVLPLTMKRFSSSGRLASSIPPHSHRLFTFALPMAYKSPTALKAEIGEYVKFTTRDSMNMDPVRIRKWCTAKTESDGKEHEGLFITVENTAGHPVKVRLKVIHSEPTSSFERTFFFAEVSLGENETRTMVLRTIPDEGIPKGHTHKSMRPERIDVCAVEVMDVQF